MDEITPITVGDPLVKEKIRTLYLKNHTIAEICKILDIPETTYSMSYYKNTSGLRDFMNDVKKERKLRQVERVSDDILQMDTTDHKYLAIQQKEAEFVRETLLKDQGYTKRTEVFGLNVNKTEPLTEEQKEKLDKLINIREKNSKKAK